jgi:replicative DNA helicase
LNATEAPPAIPADWQPAEDPVAVAKELTRLYQRRVAAQAIEQLAARLRAPDSGPLQPNFEEAAAQVAEAEEKLGRSRLVWGNSLAEEVLKYAAQRIEERKAGRPLVGVGTGLETLDRALGGLRTGMHVLGGPPAVGKTTLAVQIALAAAESGFPMLFVTLENSAANLVAKLLAARAGINSNAIDRGYADPEILSEAAAELEPALARTVFLENGSDADIAVIGTRMLQVAARSPEKRCLLIVDYLQRLAQARGFEGLRQNVSAVAGDFCATLPPASTARCLRSRACPGPDTSAGSRQESKI